MRYAAARDPHAVTVRSSNAKPASSARRTGHVSATRSSRRRCSGVRSVGRCSVDRDAPRHAVGVVVAPLPTSRRCPSRGSARTSRSSSRRRRRASRRSSSCGAGPRSVPPRRSGSSVRIVWRPLTSTSCSRPSPLRWACRGHGLIGLHHSCPDVAVAASAIRGNYPIRSVHQPYNDSSKQPCSCAIVDGMTDHHGCSPSAAGAARGVDRRAFPRPRRADAHPPAGRAARGSRDRQELQEATGASQQNVSKHLGLLLRSGLVSRSKEGNFSRLRDRRRGRLRAVRAGLRRPAPPARRARRAAAGRARRMSAAVAAAAAAHGRSPRRSGTPCPRRADRPARPLHGDAFPHGPDRLAAGRGRARVLRAEGGEGAFRRGLGSERVAVDAGAQAGRTRLRRSRQLWADDGRLLPDADGRLARRSGRRSPASSRRCARTARCAPSLPPAPGVSISRDGHTAIVQAGAARNPNEMVAAADTLKGTLHKLSTSTVVVNLTGAAGHVV